MGIIILYIGNLFFKTDLSFLLIHHLKVIMKRTKFAIGAFVLATTIFAQSCKKELPSTTNPPMKTMNGTVFIPRMINNLTPADIVSLADNQTRIRMHSALYSLAYAINANPDAAVLNYVYNFIENKDWNSEGFRTDAVLLKDVLENFPAYESDLNTTLASANLGLPYTFLSYTEIKDVLGSLDLQPVINMPNMGQFNAADINLGDFAIAPAVQLGDDIAGNFEHFDQIPAWFNGSQIGINEKEATVINKPIFVVSTYGKSMTLASSVSTPPPTQGGHGNPWSNAGYSPIWLKAINVSQRCEDNDWSEIHFTAIRGNYNGTAYSKITTSWGEGQKLKNLHKSNLNIDAFFDYPVAFDRYINEFEDLIYVYNVFEYDWYAPVWVFGRIKEAGYDVYDIYSDKVTTGRAVNSNECYMFNPVDNHQENAATRMDYENAWEVWFLGDVFKYGNTGKLLMSKWY